MAKLSIIKREEKRASLEKKHREKRANLKELARLAYARGEMPLELLQQLHELPKNSSRVRLQRRCRLCGRPHAVYKRFGLCRLCLRKYAMQGFIPGLSKASW